MSREAREGNEDERTTEGDQLWDSPSEFECRESPSEFVGEPVQGA